MIFGYKRANPLRAPTIWRNAPVFPRKSFTNCGARHPVYTHDNRQLSRGSWMQIEEWPLKKIRPYPNNPRVLRNAAEKVADSIREFGWRQPIVVDEDGVIIIGHSRLAAAQLLKLSTAPVHVAAGLPAGKVRALRIADNKTGEFSTWDESRLADELAVIMDGLGSVSVTGFSQSEFDAIAMQAQAEIEAILAPQPTRQAVLSTAAAETHEPSNDEGSGLVEDPRTEQSPAEVHHQHDEPAAHPDVVPFNVLMTVADRQDVYDAVTRAKADIGVKDTAAALAHIARSYSRD